jgi:hypothetical protein
MIPPTVEPLMGSFSSRSGSQPENAVDGVTRGGEGGRARVDGVEMIDAR